MQINYSKEEVAAIAHFRTIERSLASLYKSANHISTQTLLGQLEAITRQAYESYLLQTTKNKITVDIHDEVKV
jgi:hypothetical protein